MKKIKYVCPVCYNLVKIPEDKKKRCPVCATKLTKSHQFTTVANFKNRVWETFSLYIRLSQCYETTGSKNKGICYTCHKEYHIKELQAGHLVDGRADNVLFDENNVKIQCYGCNVARHGRQAEFLFHKMTDLLRLGYSHQSAYEYLESLFRLPAKHYDLDELLALYEKYSNLVKALR